MRSGCGRSGPGPVHLFRLGAAGAARMSRPSLLRSMLNFSGVTFVSRVIGLVL